MRIVHTLSLLFLCLSCQHNSNKKEIIPVKPTQIKWSAIDSAQISGMSTKFVFANDSVDFFKIIFDKHQFTIPSESVGISGYLNSHDISAIYFGEKDCKKKYDLYSEIGMGTNLPLNAILNSIALSQKKKFSREELDSFFRYYLLGKYAFNDYVKLYDTTPSTKEMSELSANLVGVNLSQKCNANNLLYLDDFLDFFNKNAKRKNFFFYRGIGISGNGYFLITVNEDFKSESLAENFYNTYSKFGKLYAVKCYFPYYIIEKGNY